MSSRYKQEQKRRGKLYLYTAFLAALSVSTFLMPFGFKMEDKSMMLTYLSGFLFWLGLIGTIVMAVNITNSRGRSQGFAKAHPYHNRLGLIHFFQNTPASICDVLMIVSLIGVIIAQKWLGTTIWPFIFLPIFIFSFGMHCMLNGSNYIYINYKNKKESN